MVNFPNSKPALRTDITGGMQQQTLHAQLHDDGDSEVNAIGAWLLDGRQVFSVKNYDALGDGLTDATGAFDSAVAAAGAGDVVWVPAGTYVGRMTLKTGVILDGYGTIKANGNGASDWAIRVPYAATDVVIRNVTADGGGSYGCVQIGSGGGTATPNQRITLDNVTMQNTAATVDPWRYALYVPVGIQHSRISNCHFKSNVAGGMYITNAIDLVVSGNVLEGTVVTDGIYVRNDSGVAFPQGIGLVISHNTFYSCFRNAIEVQAATTTQNFAPLVIAHNYAAISNSAQTANAFGISVPNTPFATIVGNVLYSPLLVSAGIEVGARGMSIIGNSIQGFADGIMFDGTSTDSEIASNTINSPVTGIHFSSSGAASHTRVHSNVILNARDQGIWFDATAAHFGAVIEHNQIRRDAAWTGDATRTYTGIIGDPPSSRFFVRYNRIQQGQAAPTAGFAFRGLRVSGTSYNRSEWSGNYIENESVGVAGTGVQVDTAGVLDGTVWRDNILRNLANTFAGVGAAATIKTIGRNNYNDGSTDTNSPTGFFNSISVTGVGPYVQFMDGADPITATVTGIYFGAGVPAAGLGTDGSIYFRRDGGAGTTIYQKRVGAWVATAA